MKVQSDLGTKRAALFSGFPYSVPPRRDRISSFGFWFSDFFRISSFVFRIFLLLSATPKSFGNDLESGFLHPPPSSRPWVNWFWLDGNITREGITADLEAMQRVGIGGVLLMDITQEIPPGPVRFGTPQWRDMFHHTISEAGRLGLEVNMHNGPGWSGSGGPWITPALAMQKAVWIKTNITGPTHFDALLPPLPMSLNYARDVATLAFPTLVGDGIAVPGFAPKITASAAAGFDSANLLDGNPTTSISLPAPTPRKPQYIQLEFSEPFTAAHLKLAGVARTQTFQGVLQVSDDGKKFRNVREFLNRRSDVALDFEQLSARYFRILFTKVGQASPLASLQFSELELVPIFRLDLAQSKAGLGPLPSIPHSAFRTPHSSVPPYALIRPDQVLDLSSKVDANGRLAWDAPNGNWTVLRFGYTPTGRENHPTPPEGRGLECDKLSKEAIAAHFAAFLAKLLPGSADSGSAGIPAGERAFSATHIDSWEHGYQNWTPRLPAEFQNRRGYNLLPYLPSFSGRIVANPEISERFLWDMRRTIADLWADNYAGHLAELAHQHGLQLSIEAYANGPFDELLYAARADVPMGEFWAEAEDNSRFHFSKAMASTAHTCGKPISPSPPTSPSLGESERVTGDVGREGHALSVVAAEAFTSYPVAAKWQNHPFSLKPLADAAFSEGINRLVFHRYAHQPWLDRKPGMTMGQWGIHYERTETWWEQSKPWHEYLARCQFLLQRGLFVADFCYLTAEGAYTAAPTPDKLQPSPPIGYDYDIASPEVVLNRMSVVNGPLPPLSPSPVSHSAREEGVGGEGHFNHHRLSLPDGMSYSVLVLPPTELMTPKLLRKIKELVQLGATVVGPRPSKSPSLAGAALAERLQRGEVVLLPSPPAALTEADRDFLLAVRLRRLARKDVSYNPATRCVASTGRFKMRIFILSPIPTASPSSRSVRFGSAANSRNSGIRTGAKSWELRNGACRMAAPLCRLSSVRLVPYSSCFVKLRASSIRFYQSRAMANPMPLPISLWMPVTTSSCRSLNQAFSK